jgi:hypothetical protein
VKLIRKITIGLLLSAFIFSNVTYLYAQLPYKLVEKHFIISSNDSNKEYLQLQSLIKEAESYLSNSILEKMVSDEFIIRIGQAKSLTNKSSKTDIIKSIDNLNYAIDEFNTLKQKEVPSRILEEVIPDKSFRKVIINNTKNQYVTLNSLENIDGELYASYENIYSIEGIDILKNVESIVLWKNNLTNIPQCILNLKKLKHINLRNNYIVNSEVIDTLENSGVDVQKDLNFIKNKPSQYSIKSKEDIIVINKGDSVDLKKYIYKDIPKYTEAWEITDEININKFETNAENINIIDVNDMTIKGKNIGTTKIYIKIKGVHSPNMITLTIKVK